MTILLILIPAVFHRFVNALESLLHLAYWPEGLFLALVAYLPRLLFTILGVTVLFRFLGTSFHLKLTYFLGFEMAVLLLNWEREDVVTILRRLPFTNDTLRSVAIILRALIPLAVKLHGVSTCHIVDNLLLHKAIRRLHIRALVVILGRHVD